MEYTEWLRDRGCTGKKVFTTRKEAAKVAKRIRSLGRGHMQVYHCGFCEQWHIGHWDGTGTGLRHMDARA